MAEIRFKNLPKLLSSMEEKEWIIDSFLFNYKNEDYVVILKLYSDTERKPSEYDKVKLEFIRANNINESIQAYANLRGVHDLGGFRVSGLLLDQLCRLLLSGVRLLSGRCGLGPVLGAGLLRRRLGLRLRRRLRRNRSSRASGIRLSGLLLDGLRLSGFRLNRLLKKSTPCSRTAICRRRASSRRR